MGLYRAELEREARRTDERGDAPLGPLIHEAEDVNGNPSDLMTFASGGEHVGKSDVIEATARTPSGGVALRAMCLE